MELPRAVRGREVDRARPCAVTHSDRRVGSSQGTSPVIQHSSINDCQRCLAQWLLPAHQEFFGAARLDRGEQGDPWNSRCQLGPGRRDVEYVKDLTRQTDGSRSGAAFGDDPALGAEHRFIESGGQWPDPGGELARRTGLDGGSVFDGWGWSFHPVMGKDASAEPPFGAARRGPGPVKSPSQTGHGHRPLSSRGQTPRGIPEDCRFVHRG